MSDEPRWGPASTYKAKPRWRQGREPAPPSSPPPAAARRDEDWYDESPRPPARPSARQAPPRRPATTRAPRRRRRGRGVRIAVLVVVLLLAYPVALGLTGYLSVGRVGPLPESAVAGTPGRSVLLVGTDSREGTDLEAVEGQRTDTILLLHQPLGGAPTVLVSIPRDSFVEIPGEGENKINAAYAFGGYALLVQTVEQATGIKIDGYAETNLGGFASIVDAVGGVELCPPEAIQDENAALFIEAGCQTMDGATALGYARTRDSDPRGDLARVEKQRELIAAIADEATSPATLLNPFQAFPLARSAGSALAVDDGTGPIDLGRFALAMRSVAGGSAISLTVPIADASRRTDVGVVVDWDTERATQLFDAIRSNDTESIRPLAEEQAALLGG